MTTSPENQIPKTPKICCFSFAAYTKGVIAALQSSGVHVATGLTDDEFSTVESTAGFTFPPDLRSILAEGLPMGPGFPNWRSSSRHQIRLLSSLPILSLTKQVSTNNFWAHSCWGPRPDNLEEAQCMAQTLLSRAPPLVPVFKHCYVPAKPNLAGNPVLYVRGGEVRLVSVDVGQFFKETEFWKRDLVIKRSEINKASSSPAWATAARRVEFWTEMMEPGLRRWWNLCGDQLDGSYMDDVMWKLREGGWGEDDVREMMMIDGEDEAMINGRSRRVIMQGDGDHGGVRHVRRMSRDLLRGGWSIDDVVYSLSDQAKVQSAVLEGESWVDIPFNALNPITSISFES